MKSTNIVISLDKRRIKKDGSYPLIMRLGHNGHTTSIPLGYSIQDKDWDDSSKLVKKSYVGLNSVSRINNLIQKKKADAMDILLKLDEAGQLDLLPITEIKDKIHPIHHITC
jgi:integrase/recombinase XerD